MAEKLGTRFTLKQLDNKVNNKRERYKKYRDRALGQIQKFKETFLYKKHFTIYFVLLKIT